MVVRLRIDMTLDRYMQQLGFASMSQIVMSSCNIRTFQRSNLICSGRAYSKPLQTKPRSPNLSSKNRNRHVLRVSNQMGGGEQQPTDDVGWEVDSSSSPRSFEGDGFKDQVVQIKRVSKTVKGGRQISFRAVIVIGDEKGTVGVGVASAKEIATAVQKANVDARKPENMMKVPLVKGFTFPHTTFAKYGAAKIMLKPAAEGTGVIAGGSIRSVVELAGIKNCLAKMMGSNNPLNNARAVLVAFSQMKTFKQVAEERDVSIEYLFGQPEALAERKNFIKENYKNLDAKLKEEHSIKQAV
eukprot:TRINITY_DN1666_c1_g1_i1.p2 TRINITY_DN1666_c1_g1~~TRINITY_DN1666_c1_g1_i1.p2  ORF type:complete len:298 (-),score=58.53 TRINITY_DN1666_c1_g1_i1:612-1505(-)